MKKQLLALSLLATAGLMAEKSSLQQSQHEQAGQCSSCCCSPCCCKPCCIPEPKKCIDCECYTPKFYDLQCDYGFGVDVEYLYWYGKEMKLVLGLITQTIQVEVANPLITNSTGVIVPDELVNMKSKWRSGYRLGLIYNLPCDGWDIYINYTYYHDKNNQSINIGEIANLPVPIGGKGILSLWNNPFIDSILPFTLVEFDEVSGRWRYNFNMFDGELGRKYWLSKCFNLRPYIGLRGGWTRSDYNLFQHTQLPAGAVKDFVQFNTDFRNNFWGIGLLGGVQPTWYYCPCFAIYGQMDFALLWGGYSARRKESFKYQLEADFGEVNGSSRSTNDTDGMQGVFDLGIGLRWEDNWCCDRYRSTLDIGWEHHIWYKHVTRLQLTGDYNNGNIVERILGFTDFFQDQMDMVFGGLVIRARFEF